jgi:polyhydroxybutyrate depolymerase
VTAVLQTTSSAASAASDSSRAAATAPEVDRSQTDAAPHPRVDAQVAALHAYRRNALRWDAAGDDVVAPEGTHWRSIDVDGVQRRYLVSKPPGLDEPAPLVVAFHGLRQRAPGFARMTGLVAATRAAGEVLVLPESVGPAFNDGRLGAQGPHDARFTDAVVEHLVQSGAVDQRRVTVTGFSNGAGMAMRFAGEHPGAVAAVVSVDGALIAGQHAPRPQGDVRAVLVHGDADPVQPWAGRPAGVRLTRPGYISVPATVSTWVAADRAGRVSQVVRHTDTGGQHRTAVVRTWQPTPGGARVTSIRVVGMAHRWPVTSVAALRGPDVSLEAVGATRLVVDTARTARAQGLATLSSGSGELSAASSVPGTAPASVPSGAAASGSPVSGPAGSGAGRSDVVPLPTGPGVRTS